MKDLTKGNIYKTFLLYSIPIVLSGILSKTYDLADSIIAGQFLGENGLAAVGATSSYITLISSLFWGVQMGIGVYVARLYGAKEYQKIKNLLVFYAIAMSSVLSLIIGISVIFHKPIFNFLNVDPIIFDDAFTYFWVYFIAFILINLQGTMVLSINALGISGYTLLVTILSTVLNIGGNIFTIVVLDMGVLGLAVSSLFATIVCCVLAFIKLFFILKSLGVKKGLIKLDFGLKESIIYTAPISAQQMVMYIAALVIAPIVNGIGIFATAAYAIICKIENFTAQLYQNSSRTLSNYVAQCLGSKKYSIIKKGIGVSIYQALLFTLPVVLICAFLTKYVVNLFVNDSISENAIISISVFCQKFLPFIAFNAINNVLHNLYRGTKKMNYLFCSTLLGAVSRVIFTFLLVGKYAMTGVYMAWAISWIIECIFCFFVLASGKWKPNELKNQMKVSA